MSFAPASNGSDSIRAIVGERLSLAAFHQLAGKLGGHSFVKLVLDRPGRTVHFINHATHRFHSDYIAEAILGVSPQEIDNDIDRFNESVYMDPDRRFYLGLLALHPSQSGPFFTLETVEVDNMDVGMIQYFFQFVKDHVDASLPLFWKPANHGQEKLMAEMDPARLPRIFPHELFASAQYIALNPGTSKGRLRVFESEAQYKELRATLEWFDIIVMDRVPDDIPRISGIINAQRTTPLSHTNVLASGWQIPNCIQLGVMDRIRQENLNGQWVEFTVTTHATEVGLTRVERPTEADSRPAWSVHKIKLEEPETVNTPILSLERLRMSDRYRYGTKAANLGELQHVLANGSERLTGFYRVKRPPRANLLHYLAHYLGKPETADLNQAAWEFIRGFVQIPRGIAIPFSVQQEFLESSPKIQQAIGKLKMALELNARQVDSLCIGLQQMIRGARMPERIRNAIDAQIAVQLSGVSSFVVRSSSNAEDLENFSAAGIYESINHVTTAENIFESIKQVWASLVSPRSVRLRQEVGISLDDSYMGVIIQEEVKADLGGVMVTTNPLERADFRSVYLNVAPRSAVNVVQGAELPYQCLCNTVEGGGRTLSVGWAKEDVTDHQKENFQKLAFTGRFLQSHFSPDYLFNTPVDIEWVMGDEGAYILQLRPFSR